jgi:hypothetical protein
MSTHDSPTIRRFVRTAWIMLAFQLVFAAGAAGVAIWAASAVRHAVDQRDLLQARVAELEAGQNRAAPAPAPVVEEVTPAPEPGPVNEVAPPPEPVRNAPAPVVRIGPPVRQPPVRTPPATPPAYVPPIYTQPPVYVPPPRVDDDKPTETRDDPPPQRPRRPRPRINIDIPGLFGGGSRERPTRNPTNPNTRNPTTGATQPNLNGRQSARPPATSTPNPATVVRRRPRPATNTNPQPPQIR